jgi:hypothetical protein
MAVNINTVYTTVLYILNKEQRGYIPPAEFNSLATQVQIEIFESYFPDGNQFNRPTQQNIANNTEFFNMFKDNAYKLYPFEETVSFVYNSTNDGWASSSSTRPLYRIGEIISTFTNSGSNVESMVDLLSKKEYSITQKSKLTSSSQNYPIAHLTNLVTTTITDPIPFLKISPKPNSVLVNCILLPSTPEFAFTTGQFGEYIYSSTNSTNFQLDISEQTNIITNILKYAGVIINDPTIIQTATQEAMKVEQNEKS